jgi:cytochrome P450
VPSVYEQLLDQANRADPYPLCAPLREQPVSREADGRYVVSTYREIVSLLHDPRLSSDESKFTVDPAGAGDRSFLFLDPPEHDVLRRQTMRHFGPPHSPRRVHGMIGQLQRHVTDLIDALDGRTEIDLVDDFAYPFPVTVICDLLGVPEEDEPRFHPWAEAIVAGLNPDPAEDPREAARRSQQAAGELAQYLIGLARAHAESGADNMFAGMARTQERGWRMAPGELIRTAILLLVAGHETTVNLLANGMLTLLRHPDELERLAQDSERVIPTVEELLRYEPPVQIMLRHALSDVEVGGVTIPTGAPISLVIAAGNRDPQRFAEPDRFIPDRRDNQHLGFGSGIHNCFGAPLARLEVQIALTELVRRLENPRLVEDPPPYRANALLRGPRHLRVAIDGVRP